ncbi:MAG: hypothetical protein EOM37_01660 [Proteobacteria bacterium]|jgi:hypothetical protein|nr:hypothetical protein [Alphaproteobacteria bacterium]NCC02744.1 hypothetical protein [Pseudomonadota bacterium]
MPFQISELLTLKPRTASGALQAFLEDPAESEKYISLLKDTNQYVSKIKTPQISNLMFEVEGIPVKARHVPMDNPKDQLIIWATLGYMPYSMNEPAQRRCIVRILESTYALPNVKFGIDQEMRIVALYRQEITKPLASNYFFVPLLEFMQTARPYMKLIGECLS